jgi:hypothetical protein
MESSVEFELETMVVKLKHCGHYFHQDKDCSSGEGIKNWLENHSDTCPSCRSEVVVLQIYKRTT